MFNNLHVINVIFISPCDKVLRVKKCNLNVIKYCFIKSWIKIEFACYKIVFTCDKIGHSLAFLWLIFDFREKS